MQESRRKDLLTGAGVKRSLVEKFTIVNIAVGDLLAKSLASQKAPAGEAPAGPAWRRAVTLPSLPEATVRFP